MKKQKVKLFLCNLNATIEEANGYCDIYFENIKQKNITDFIKQGEEVVIRVR